MQVEEKKQPKKENPIPGVKKSKRIKKEKSNKKKIKVVKQE